MRQRKIGEDRISKITLKKNQVIVSFDEHKKIAMSENAFTDFALYEGKEMSSSEMRRLLDSVSLDKLMNYALRLAAKDSYTEHDVRLKLLDKGAEQGDIRKIIARLKELKLIDDVLYANYYANELADLRHYGKNKVIYDLEFHGIPQHIIADLSFPEERELERAKVYCEQIDHKFARTPNAAKKQKVIRACQNRGFSYHVSAEAANSITPNDEKVEKEALKKAYEACKTRYGKKYQGYELSRRIYAYLSAKGYRYENIKELVEEDFQ